MSAEACLCRRQDGLSALRILNADAGRECNAGKDSLALMPIDEVVHTVKADQADEDEINGDNVVEQPRHDQNQNAGNDGNPRREMGTGNNHGRVLLGFERDQMGQMKLADQAGRARPRDNALRRVGF
jgi:hypothetical protein